MKVLGLTWIGTRTSHFRETVSFFEQVVGLPVGNQREEFVRLDLPDSSCIEVFGPRDTEHRYFTTGPVVGFLVEDLEVARHDFSRHGVELLGPIGGEAGGYRWQHFRAPDRNVYEIVEDPGRAPPGPPVGPLRITGLAWMGTRTVAYEATQEFFGGLMALPVVEDLPELTEYRLPDASAVEVFLAGSPLDPPHFSTGPVPGLGVKDLAIALAHLRSQKVPILQTKRGESGGWARFRAPDGCVYELKGPRKPG